MLCDNLATILYRRVATCSPEVEKIPAGLFDIITSWAQGQAQNIKFATTRVPSLDGVFKDPSRGYRILVTPSLIDQLIAPPANTDNNRELFALRKNPQTLEYAAMYAPSGLNLETHFILIFNLQPILPSPSLGPRSSTFSRNDINSWAWNAKDVSPIPSPTTSATAPSPTTSVISPSQSASVIVLPTIQPGVLRRRSPLGVASVLTTSNYLPYPHESGGMTNTPFSTGCANTSYVVEAGNSDGMEHAPYLQYSDGNPTVTVDDVELDVQCSDENSATVGNPVMEPAITDGVELDDQRPYRNATASGTLTTWTGVDVMKLCHDLGSTHETIAAAKFRGGANSLLTMVLNHRAMMSVLQTLNFCDMGTRPPVAKGKVVTFDDGLKLSVEDVLHDFGWTWDSFKHKTTWYMWAEDAVRSSEWDSTQLGT
jgi:hypothetical protein